jgi:AraC-like DNA-binding protein
MRAPADEMRDVHVPLDALWGARRTASLRQRLLETPTPEAKLDAMEQALAEIFRPGLHPAVAFALTTFGRRPETTSIAAVTGAVGLSARAFIERFKTEVGLTPKRYCRILRFQRALGRAHRGQRIDWIQVALDSGYFDQAHFIHDFRAFAGLTPTAYLAARTEFQNHVKFLQADTNGT